MIRAPRVSCRSPRSPLSSHHHAHDLHTVEDTKAPELTWGAELTQDEVQTFGLLAGVTHPTPPSPRRLRTGRGAWEGREGGGRGALGTHLWREATRSFRACTKGRIQWCRRTTLWDRLRWKASILTSRGTWVWAWGSNASSRSGNSSLASSGGHSAEGGPLS